MEMCTLRKTLREWRRAPMWAAALVPLLFAPAAQANTTFFNDAGSVCSAWAPCWQAGTFGVLIGLGQAIGPTYSATLDPTSNVNYPGSDNINGRIGVGQSSYVYDAANGSGTKGYHWGGPIDFADAGATVSNGYTVPLGHNVLTNTTVAGGVYDGSQLVSVSGVITSAAGFVTQALTQADSISDYWRGWTASGTMSVSGFGSQTVTVVNNANTLGRGLNSIGTTTAGVYVYNAGSISTGAALNITVGPNTLIIINDSGAATFGAYAVSVTSGMTDQVLFNLYSTVAGTVLSINGGAGGKVIDADFLVREAYNAQNATLNGRILGGLGTLTLGAAFTLNAPPETGPVPEPEDWLLLSGGLGVIAYAARRKMRLQSGFPMARRFRDRMKADAADTGGCAPAGTAANGSASGGNEPPAPEVGLPPPRGGGGGSGGGGSGGVPLSRDP